MKNFQTVFFLIVIFSSLLNGQEQAPIEKKMAMGQDGRIFINKDLGVYLWLSTSSDENSKKIRLMSDSSDKYSNPMYFDTEGYNTIRTPSCVDTITKRTLYPEKDIIFEVYSDSKSPNTQCKIFAKNTTLVKAIPFYSGDAEIVLTSSDALSGVDKIYYSMASSPFTIYSDTIKIKTEGEVLLKYYSCDKVGNIENIKDLKFILDISAPETTCDYSLGKLIKLEATDKLSGVKTIFYQINNGPVKIYSAPIPVKLLGKDGELIYWSTDKVNNTENKKSINVTDILK